MQTAPRYPIPDGFEYIRELGQGTLGYSALLRRKNDERSILVCKFVEKSKLGSNEKINRFKERIDHIKYLKSPFIVPITEIIEIGDVMYLIREYLPSESLAECVSTFCTIDPNFIVAVWNILVRTFSHLHSHHIYPSFIKPSNLFFVMNKFIMITDLCPPPSDLNMLVHSPKPIDIAFLAPEFFSHKTEPSFEADYWALGVLLVFMLTGSLPWNKKNVFSMVQSINTGKYEFPSSLPESVDAILRKILVVNPSERLALSASITTVVQSNTETRQIQQSRSELSENHKLDMIPRQRRASIVMAKAAHVVLKDFKMTKGGTSMTNSLLSLHSLNKVSGPDVMVRCRAADSCVPYDPFPSMNTK